MRNLVGLGLFLITLLVVGCGGTSAEQAQEAYKDGLKLTQENRWFESINLFDDAIAGDSEFADAYAQRGNAYSFLGISRAAINDAEKAINLDPDSWLAYSVRGHERSIAGRNEEAIVDLGKSIELNPDYMFGYLRRGKAHMELGNNEQALADFEQGLSLTDDARYIGELEDLISSIQGG